jgi:hypothetical protein
VFLLELVIIIAVEGMRLVATKKPTKLRKLGFLRRKWDLPGTPMFPVEIIFPQRVMDGMREESSCINSGLFG